MEAIEAILTRRSIRKYTGEAVSEEFIHQLLRSAMSAPSSRNGQPWRFMVITDRKLLDDIPKFHPYSSMLKEAPMAIAVCADRRENGGGNMWEQDCSAATQNILITAHALGLGAVWLGVYPIKERVTGLQRLLSLPPGVTPLSLIAVGHPAEQKPGEDRFDDWKVHYNQW